MKKYTVWCRFRSGLDVPDERDLEWNLVPQETEVEPYHWGYDTHEQASLRGIAFERQWDIGVMEVVIREVELPD